MDDVYETRTHYSLEDLAREGREAFFRALAKDPKEWEQVSKSSRSRWEEVAEGCAHVCEQQLEMSWPQLARRLAFTFYREERLEKTAEVLRIAWEAVARHICNLILAEDRDDLNDIAAHDWTAWAGEKLNKQEQTA